MSSPSLPNQVSGAGNTGVATDPEGSLISHRFHFARGPVESGRQTTLETARGLPDLAICRARTVRLTDYADCLVEKPFECPYALSFGYGVLCRHPRRDEIVARTVALSP
jgi:hypothetical protein